GAEAFSLEIAATRTAAWFLARAPARWRREIQRRVAVAYPQAEIRSLDRSGHPTLDPAYIGPAEQAAGRVMLLRQPEYLPVRTFSDTELGASERGPSSLQADPVLGILGAMQGLPDGWRALSQLVLRPAPD